ncbi:hypothetical protein [Streptomyces sp. SID14436]|uniref:Uncharacterized protein n=2 Tax=unclassified Streptomyces TaxID=2593676 RepID=A0A6G3QTJ5_9ACTN|nr:hypothetical protein [Streptomyces sp. SID14436]NEA86665.1 hypothetical protein [Streptomyces sp. SID14436]
MSDEVRMTTTVHIERSLFGLTAEGSPVVWTDLPMGPAGAVHVADGTALFISNAQEHDATLTLQISDRTSERVGEGFVLVGSWPFNSHLGKMVLDTPNAGGSIGFRLKPNTTYTMHVWCKGGESAQERFYGELRGVTPKTGLEDYLVEFVPTGSRHAVTSHTQSRSQPPVDESGQRPANWVG